MILEEKYTLSNGVGIPKLGLGTWFISDKNAGQAVKDAAEIGTGILIPRRPTIMKEALERELEPVA